MVSRGDPTPGSHGKTPYQSVLGKPDGDSSAGSHESDRPYAGLAAVYTTVFLLFILGVVPSLAFVAEHWLPDRTWTSFTAHAGAFWTALRRLVGIAVFTIGLAGYLFCSIWLMYVGRGPHVEFDPPRQFVATGPFRWVRNPVVITLLVTVLGEGLYLGSFGIVAFVLLIGPAFAHYQVTRIEEPRLRERFGEDYAEYCRRVPRWTPRPPAP